MAREFKDVPLEAKKLDEKGIFEGYGSLFGLEPDSHGDLVAKGAFTQSIQEGGRNGTGIALLWQHRPEKIPGVWLSLQEDTKGLKVRGQLSLDTELGRDIYAIMKLGIDTGTFKLSLSIGFDTIDFSIDSKTRVRTLRRVSLWECSLVTFGARLGATVDTIKTTPRTVRSLEEMLLDLSLSKSAAQYVISLCRPSLKNEIIEGEEMTSILDALKQINESMSTHAL